MSDNGEELVRQFLFQSGVMPAEDAHRLKLLKDEIRQPYFLKLKRFLLEQGVKGPDDSAPNLKVYPARKHVLMIAKLSR